MTLTPMMPSVAARARADLARAARRRQPGAGDDADAAGLGDRGGQRRQRDAHRHAALDDGQAGGAVADGEGGHVHVDASLSSGSAGIARGHATAASVRRRVAG